MNKIIALMLPIALLSSGIQNNQLQENIYYASRETNLIIPAENEYFDLVALQPYKLKYADVEQYISKDFNKYKKEIVIGYVLNLEKKMENCNIVYREDLSKGKYLIFKMEKAKIYDYITDVFLAWEIDNPSGGFVLAGYGCNYGRVMMDNILSVMEADCGSSTEYFFNLNEARETFKMGSINSEQGVNRIADSDWVIYSERVYVEKLNMEHSGNIYIYNLFTEEEIELRMVDESTSWYVFTDLNDDCSYKFIKYQLKEGNIIETIDEITDFQNNKYLKMLENPRPTISENVYFEYKNHRDEQDFYSRLVVEGDYVYFYRLPHLEGRCESVESWDTQKYPSNTLAVIKRIFNNVESYIYVYEKESKLIIEEVNGSVTKVIKILD